MYAVRYSLDFGRKDSGCLQIAEKIATSKGDNLQTYPLDTLPNFKKVELTAEESQAILQILLDQLGDEDLQARIAAGASLASWGDAAAIPKLEEAMAKEPDPDIRALFGNDLEKLRKEKE